MADRVPEDNGRPISRTPHTREVPKPESGPGPEVAAVPEAAPSPGRPGPARRTRSGKTRPAGWRPPLGWWPPSGRDLVKYGAIAVAVLGLLFIGVVLYAYATLPDPTKLDLTAGSVAIVDRHGNLIEERNAQGSRVTPVKLADISEKLKNATIAVEDRHFYQHHGVDWGRVVKAFFVDVIARRPEQGASTITQQLAKIAILQSPQKTPLRKFRELLLATALEQRYSKDQILELYLNTIFYGHHATGIEAASQVYFGKHAKDLTLAEASLLAGLPNGPTYYDPLAHPDRAQQRQAVVLDAMVSSQMITQDQADQAKAEKLTFTFKEQRTTQAPHFVDYVFQQLEQSYGANTVEHGGFVVKTSLDLNLQRAAQHAVELGIQRLGPLGADNGDLVAIDPKTGQILAMVGSVDFYNNTINGQFNVAADGLRQPGSSFKPYAYETAFKDHTMTMGDILDDTSRHFANGRFHDFDFRDMGKITAHKALLLSRNIPALETMQKAGVDNVIAFAHEMGITTNLKSEVTTAIGSSDVKMLDHVAGYSVFATGGTEHPPISILEVTDRNGNTLDKPNPPQPKQVMTQQEAYLITYILKDYSTQWNLGWNRPMAGKSGTTNNYRDAWMMAYSPNIAMGAWVGHTGPGNQNMNGVYGTMVGSSVLRDFINNGLSAANIPVATFQQPSGLVSGPPCSDSSNASPSASPSASSSSSSSSSPSASPKPSARSSINSSERELYLPGTECKAPPPTPNPTPTLVPSIVPSILPSILPSASESATPSPSASGSASGTAAPAGSGAPSQAAARASPD